MTPDLANWVREYDAETMLPEQPQGTSRTHTDDDSVAKAVVVAMYCAGEINATQARKAVQTQGWESA